MNEVSELLIKKPTVCAMLMRKAEEFFQEEEHERAFLEWYRCKYGHEYEQSKRTAV